MNTRITRKKIFVFTLFAPIFLIFFVLFINLDILSKSSSFIYSKISSAPTADVGIILGAKVRADDSLTDMLMDRADTAFDLYRLGKIKKILISGDHSRKDYDEVNAVKDYLLGKGVPPNYIFLDHAGFDTYDSMYRAKKIFQVNSAIVVTQNFHLPRAIYIARSLGIEAAGLSADRHIYRTVKYNQGREIFSRVKAFFDVNFGAKPKFLGEVIPISGDGYKSWDKFQK